MMATTHYYIDYKYINLLSPKLSKFQWKTKNLAVCRCPKCGDSKKNLNKKRFYLFEYKGSYIAKCHNCGYSSRFSTLLKSMDSLLFREYIKENFMANATGRVQETLPKVAILPPKTIRVVPDCLVTLCKRVDSLPLNHPAVGYVDGRKIPQSAWKKLYYTDDFAALARSLDSTIEEGQLKSEPRLVLPYFDCDKNLFAIQGRLFIRPCLGIRYLTIKKEGITTPKIYGMDAVNFSVRNYAVEGPIDSLFLRNAWALSGSDVDLKSLPFDVSNTIFAYDNEPRNEEIVSRMNRRIDEGYSIVIWPNDLKQKDINDMVLAGMNPQKLIESCTYKGLTAKIRFNNWKKV